MFRDLEMLLKNVFICWSQRVWHGFRARVEILRDVCLLRLLSCSPSSCLVKVMKCEYKSVFKMSQFNLCSSETRRRRVWKKGRPGACKRVNADSCTSAHVACHWIGRRMAKWMQMLNAPDAQDLTQLFSTEGCPASCNNHGVCLQEDGKWQCACNSDREGSDCSVPLEKDCGDGKDNDEGECQAKKSN